jgi:hypothetical protein
VLVHRDVTHLGLVGAEGTERTDVRRRLGQHDVARVHEDAGHQIECLLRAGGHDHLVGVGTDAD